MMKNTVLVDHLPLQKVNSALKNTLLVLIGSLIIAISAKLSFYLPFSPVPVTGQTFAVLLLASVLGAKRGFAAVVAYIVEGLVGFPFFAGGLGFAILKGPTFGYLIGFALAAYWVGKLAEEGKEKTFLSALPSFIQGYVIIFACGVAWLSQFTGIQMAVLQGFLFFIPGEIIKLAILSLILPAAWKSVK